MFTGIISEIGSVRRIEADGDTRFVIGAAFDVDALAIGASVACAGACLTVIEKGADAQSQPWFAVAASAETLAKTTLGDWAVGSWVNLERALKIGDELGGHLVSGHVDCVGTLVALNPEGDSVRMLFGAPAAIADLIAAKGSIAVDGVSLTVNEVVDAAPNQAQDEASSDDGFDAAAQFGVNIIAHTLEHTTLGGLTVGARVNLEADQMARYAARLLSRSADAR